MKTVIAVPHIPSLRSELIQEIKFETYNEIVTDIKTILKLYLSPIIPLTNKPTEYAARNSASYN